MKKVILIMMCVFLVLTVCSCSNKKVVAESKNDTITDTLNFFSNVEDGKVVSDINLILIDNNGNIVGSAKTGKDGKADIKVTVPLDKRYDSKTGTVTVIGYNNEKYRRTVMYEVPVMGTGQFSQNITMIPKDGGRDDEVHVMYGNMFHMVPMTLADKYVPWNTK